MFPKKPPMGFNTWNTFAENISDEMIRQTADAMVEKGLLAAGYEYLVIDDCWSERQRDSVTDKIIPDRKKFPNGMKAVSDYVHEKGLKFGMYSCAGVRTCADYPASFDHEFLDAKTFAEYGADFLKYDFCYRPENVNGPLLYRKMSMALKASGRDIMLSACNWGSDNVHQWIRSTGAGMYRSTGDITDSFVSFRDIFLSQIDNFVYSAPGCFNDIDMLTVGMRNRGNVAASGCTDTEYRTEFALWCMFSAPLMLGCDVRNIDDVTLKLVTNKHLLRINQDEEGRPPFIARYGSDNMRNIYFKVMSDNEFALMFTNLEDGEYRLWLPLEDLGIPVSSGKGLSLINAFTGEDAGIVKENMYQSLEAHDCAVYIAKIVDA
ncbi:MAG: glycoside hydrolase family 27 protein [Oscillospiraceae bacterium]|nr:glycoside hydrolase family 27 protein [Oscillospiraceae bacterium]